MLYQQTDLVNRCVYTKYTGSGTNNALFKYNIFYYKIMSMSFCNITISYSSKPYVILGEMFKLKL